MTELGDDARALIDATQEGDDPSPVDRTRLRARLFGTAVGLGALAAGAEAKAAIGGSASLGGATAGAGTAGKLALAGAVLALGITASVALVGRPSQAPRPERTPPAADTQGAVSAAVVPPIPVPAAEPPVPVVSAVTPSVELGAHAPSATRMRAAQASSLAQELSLLGPAQLALQSQDFERALLLLRRHAERFPRGVLLPERLAAQAIAYCGAGQPALGRQQLVTLAREAPKSPLLGRASAGCETP